MKIRQHPRMHGIVIGDEVYSYPRQLFARVEETFPAAVCVKLGILSFRSRHPIEIVLSPQLWRADDIENLSVCRYCGSRDDLCTEHEAGVPFRVCVACSHLPLDERTVAAPPPPNSRSADPSVDGSRA